MYYHQEKMDIACCIGEEMHTKLRSNILKATTTWEVQAQAATFTGPAEINFEEIKYKSKSDADQNANIWV